MLAFIFKEKEQFVLHFILNAEDEEAEFNY